MNIRVRKFLIEIARKNDKPVYYLDLLRENGLSTDLESPQVRRQLKQLLTEISEFENENGRPMLTSLAINKNLSDPGYGFFDLAEKFGKGKATNLQKNFWAIEEAKRTRKYWQDEINYLKFANLDNTYRSIEQLYKELILKNNKQTQWQSDYIFFVSQIQILRKEMKRNEHLSLSDNSLYKTLDPSLQGYELFISMWLKEMKNGIASRGQSVLSNVDFKIIVNNKTFKNLAYELIADTSLENYNNFHSWWIKNKKIKNRPLLINRAAAACNPENLSSTVDNTKFWITINYLIANYGFSFKSDVDWNWYEANEQLTSWLDIKLSLLKLNSLNRNEQTCWRNIFVWLIFLKANRGSDLIENELELTNQPNEGVTEIPKRNRKFTGSNPDYAANAKEQKELGDAGEELVKEREKKYLISKGRFKEAELVEIVLDGNGYDIMSFNEKGEKIFIEVKTTAGKASIPFFLSENEMTFMQKNKVNYYIYRVYNYNEEKNAGRFFILKNDIEDKIFKEPINYRVYLKKKKKN